MLLEEAGIPYIAIKKNASVGGTWLQTLKRDNVELVNESVAEITADALIGESGKCTLLWPWKILQLWQWTKSVETADYRFS